MKTDRRFLLLAALATGLTIAGDLAFAVIWRRTADMALAGAVIPATVVVVLGVLALAMARRRLHGPGRRPRATGPNPSEPLTVIPLGNGTAAVVYTEPAARLAPHLEADTARGPDVDAAATAIWDAVTATVAEVAAATAVPVTPPPGRPSRLARLRRRRPNPPPADSR